MSRYSPFLVDQLNAGILLVKCETGLHPDTVHSCETKTGLVETKNYSWNRHKSFANVAAARR